MILYIAALQHCSFNTKSHSGKNGPKHSRGYLSCLEGVPFSAINLTTIAWKKVCNRSKIKVVSKYLELITN